MFSYPYGLQQLIMGLTYNVKNLRRLGNQYHAFQQLITGFFVQRKNLRRLTYVP